MQRRKFITDTALGISLFLSNSIFGCQSKVLARNKKVIVIGAGISGLTVAKELQNNGFEVTVLEAQEKVGGRLRTDRSLGIAFDEGASWIHGIDKNPITKLAEQAGMDTFYTNDNSRRVYDLGGKIYNSTVFDDTEDAFYAILDSLMKKGSDAQSFETIFKTQYPQYFNNRLWRFFLSTYLTFDTGDLNKLSSLLYNEGEEFGGVEKIAVNGYDTIATHLAKDLKVILNQRVTKVDYTDASIKVTHNNAITESDYVVVTVPLGVLKANKIAFIPNLPKTKQNAIDGIGMNCVNKFLLKWNKVFWDDVQYICYTPEVSDKFNYFVNVSKFQPTVPALMTFAYADDARKTETRTDGEVIEEIMKHLKDIYGTNTPNPTHLRRTRWNTNPNALGAYCYTAVGTKMSHFEDLAAAINNRIFFAGEHTEVDYFSTVHGAFLSGLREAEKIKAL